MPSPEPIELDPRQQLVALGRRDELLDEARELERMARAKRASAKNLTRTWQLEEPK